MFKVTKDNVPSFLRALQELAEQEVLVGVPSEKSHRDDADGKPSEITNAEIAFINEKGSPANNIPARPHFDPGIRAALPRIEKAMKTATKEALSTGDKNRVYRQLNIAGLAAQNSIRAEITKGIAPALAMVTLAARRRGGRTGTTPLINTGEYLSSITYVLRRRK